MGTSTCIALPRTGIGNLHVWVPTVDAKTILRHHRVARSTLSSEIIFNLWSIVLGDSVDHNVRSVWVNVRSTLFECNLSLVM
jgi:hypothetical protein